jgi:uncharacterized protein
MKTSREITERIEKLGVWGKLTLLDPQRVAQKCINGLFRKDSVIMVNPFCWLLLSLIPVWIKLPMLTKSVRRELCA